MATQNHGGGRGSNLTQADRKKGGEHSHGGQGKGQGSLKSKGGKSGSSKNK
ncbi:hypothetical protein Lqui_2980 [Legionella quinlivanii]|uniref:Stress-induced protein n=1 Tax=Legionella quinlivanii TaxID=45073 RepID=A0A0W0XKP7_9GAMM|nr:MULTISPECIES: hypothetical protein [Legionella]KTD45119.1 hypothetical protein Lqui_2980 [Legionella quinlivanii]MCE3045534.1 hypothetical protein [Legionella sp. 16cNR16C]MCW8452066.1 hypothetical protein [Legionella quinlivanii]SEG43908.1 hypothetical protein SAMN02746093_02948 [Legionella quinlivanii DSM 21216]STY09736.1 Uncharacterised protein [Legionella quinlivanii]